MINGSHQDTLHDIAISLPTNIRKKLSERIHWKHWTNNTLQTLHQFAKKPLPGILYRKQVTAFTFTKIAMSSKICLLTFVQTTFSFNRNVLLTEIKRYMHFSPKNVNCREKSKAYIQKVTRSKLN